MTPETLLGGAITLHCGDCLAVLDELPANSVDSVVTDPPYHLTSIVSRYGAKDSKPAKHQKSGLFKRAGAGFMGKQWDGGDIAFDPDTWARVLRVLKPGGYILAFASTKGFGRMSVALEDAGFITHPMIAWVFSTGFPKAARIQADGFEAFRYGGQSLKPALEPVYMGQKPFESGLNGTQNIVKHGTGAVNIEGCRVGDVNGRWPANLIHDGSDEVIEAFPGAPGALGRVRPDSARKTATVYGQFAGNSASIPRGDKGSAARFFYSAKATKKERAGSKHPTVKPLTLMRYLVRLVTPPGGTVLDPFAGTGSTGIAALHEEMSAVLIERETEYQADIRRRTFIAASELYDLYINEGIFS